MTATRLYRQLSRTRTAALVAVIGLATAARGVLPLGAAYPLKAAAVFGLGAAIVSRWARREHPFAALGAANVVTTIRAMAVALVAGFVTEAPDPRVALTAVMLTAGVVVLDGLDGWLARRFRTQSAFGARFDMEVDALLILMLSILAWRYAKAGWWVLLIGAMRYGFVAAGARLRWLTSPLPVSYLRKAICVVQTTGLAIGLVPAVPTPVSEGIGAVCLAALTWSFGADVVWLARHRSDPAVPPAFTGPADDRSIVRA